MLKVIAKRSLLAGMISPKELSCLKAPRNRLFRG